MKVWGTIGGVLLLLVVAGGAQSETLEAVVARCLSGEPMPAGAVETQFCQAFKDVRDFEDPEVEAKLLQFADMGYAPAQFWAATAYRSRGDIGLAMPLLLKAAEQGLADAQAGYGWIYLRGEDGIEPDTERALPWLRKAAEQDLLKAQIVLGRAFLFGDSVAQDDGEAFIWLLKAAKGGDRFAQEAVGIMYLAGRGTPLDQVEGLQWLEKAARANSSHAQFRLARVYQGVESVKDPTAALTWFLVVEAAPYEADVSDEIAALTGTLSPEEVSRARANAETIRSELPEPSRIGRLPGY